MNEKINGISGLDWNALKQLSEQNKEADQFDLYDLILFHKFFNDLYNKKCGKEGGHNSGVKHSRNDKHLHEQVETLNRTFTLPELGTAIKKSKNNKSVSEDLISNEMLKNLSGKSEQILLKLFNDCLQRGVYPWSNSITTPLHKKGDRQNPDNYRAIRPELDGTYRITCRSTYRGMCRLVTIMFPGTYPGMCCLVRIMFRDT